MSESTSGLIQLLKPLGALVLALVSSTPTSGLVSEANEQFYRRYYGIVNEKPCIWYCDA